MVEVIEDGITEYEYKFERGYSHIALQIFTEAQKIVNPIISTSYVTYTTPIKKTVTITTLHETNVA